MLERVQVGHVGLVPAEDLGSGAEVVGEVLAVLLPHLPVAAAGVDLGVEGDIIGGPIACTDQSQRQTQTINMVWPATATVDIQTSPSTKNKLRQSGLCIRANMQQWQLFMQSPPEDV